MSTPKKSYNPLQIALHWLIAVLIIANYFISDGLGHYFREYLTTGVTPTNWMVNFHIYVGITILVAVVLRFIVRVISSRPEKIGTGNELLDKLAHYVHEVLYTLMFLVPLFGVIAWYLKIHWMGDIHTLTMDAMMMLVLAHAAGALFHHYILKDRLLLRMLGRP